MPPQPTTRGDLGARGATLVEYALLIALICVVILGSVSALQDDAGDELQGRGDSIGNPTLEGTTTSTTHGGGPPTTTSPSTTTPGYSGNVEANCPNVSGDTKVCTFSLDPAPDVATIVTWSIDPPTNTSGGPPPAAVEFLVAGSYSIRAVVDGKTVQAVVVCKKSGTNLKCGT